MAYPVKWMHSGMQGAPVLSNQWGDLVALLDACLMSGFNSQTCNGITVSAGVATASFGNGGHGFVPYQVVEVSGASGLDGQHRVTAVTSTTVSFAAPAGAVSYSGACVVKAAAVGGWSKPYSGTHKGAYKSTHPTSSGCYLRVDNSLATKYTTTYAKYAKVTLCEGMTGIDSITGARVPYNPAKPTLNEGSSGTGINVVNGWFKWLQAWAGQASAEGDGGAGARSWLLVGDSRTFYLLINPRLDLDGLCGYSFGDYQSYAAADPLNALLVAHDHGVAVNNAGQLYYYSYQNQFAQTGYDAGRGLPVGPGQAHLPFAFMSLHADPTINNYASGENGGVGWPNPANYSVELAPVYLVDNNKSLRGKLRGLLFLPHTACTVPHLSVLEQDGGIYLFASLLNNNNAALARAAFDLTDWG